MTDNKLLAALKEKDEEIDDLENRSQGAFNALANISDTLRVRGYSVGLPVDERVIQLAHHAVTAEASLTKAQEDLATAVEALENAEKGVQDIYEYSASALVREDTHKIKQQIEQALSTIKAVDTKNRN